MFQKKFFYQNKKTENFGKKKFFFETIFLTTFILDRELKISGFVEKV